MLPNVGTSGVLVATSKPKYNDVVVKGIRLSVDIIVQ